MSPGPEKRRKEKHPGDTHLLGLVSPRRPLAIRQLLALPGSQPDEAFECFYPRGRLGDIGALEVFDKSTRGYDKGILYWSGMHPAITC